MKIWFLLICLLLCFFIVPIIASAESHYAKIDVYYNDQLYPGAATAKPFLKVGEPFKLRFDITPSQKCELFVMLTTIDEDDFRIVKGPTNKIGQYIGKILEKNETITYEWIVVPTENWAGGSVPINFYYQLNDLNSFDILISGEFTAAYLTVSEEYYDDEPVETPIESTVEEPAKAPGFILPLAVGMLLLAGICRRNT